MPGNQSTLLPRLLSGRYCSWLLRCCVATYALSPLVYEWFWPHTDAYHNTYAFWGEGYFVILFLFNLVLCIPALYLAILLLDWFTHRLEPGTTSNTILVLIVFFTMLFAQVAVKAWLFSMPFFSIFRDAAGPTFVAALVSIIMLWIPLTRKLRL